MIDLEFLQNCKYFEKLLLTSGDILFREGEKDSFLYIIYDGEIVIEKKVQSEENEFKILSYLRTGNILGEGSLIHTEKKQVQVRASRKTELLRIEKNNFPKFMEEFPKKAYNLLIQIIAYTNARLLQANSEITTHYEISQAISKLPDVSIKSIYGLLDTIEQILAVDQILYLEKNPVVEEYFKLRYHSGLTQKIQNSIIILSRNICEFSQLDTQIENIFLNRASTALRLGGVLHGYLIVANKHKVIDEHMSKLLESIALSFVGVIRQKEILDIEKNKAHIKNL